MYMYTYAPCIHVAAHLRMSIISVVVFIAWLLSDDIIDGIFLQCVQWELQCQNLYSHVSILIRMWGVAFSG